VTGMYAPISSIEPIEPVPSLLTVARPLPAGSLSEQPDDTGLPTWRTGVAWNSFVCSSSHLELRCPDGDRTDADPDERVEVHTEAFRWYTPISCDWVLGDKPAAEAEALTNARRAWAASRALWLGEGLPDETDQPSLRRSAELVAGGADDIDDQIARLLDAYYDATDGLGGAVLHVPLNLIVELTKTPLLYRDGDTYRTAMATAVSPGPGYPAGASTTGANGFGPRSGSNFLGNANDEAWVYITGPVEYAFSPTRVLPDTDADRRGLYRLNRYEVWAEREGIVRFDPCSTFAALVTSPVGPLS